MVSGIRSSLPSPAGQLPRCHRQRNRGGKGPASQPELCIHFQACLSRLAQGCQQERRQYWHVSLERELQIAEEGCCRGAEPAEGSVV